MMNLSTHPRRRSAFLRKSIASQSYRTEKFIFRRSYQRLENSYFETQELCHRTAELLSKSNRELKNLLHVLKIESGSSLIQIDFEGVPIHIAIREPVSGLHRLNLYVTSIDGEKPLGFLTFKAQGQTGLIQELIVVERFRRSSLGTRLLLTAICVCRAAGYTAISFSCEDPVSNEEQIRGFFEKSHFSVKRSGGRLTAVRQFG